MKYKDNLIHVAEIIDAWRIVPRLLVLAYMYLVMKLYIWFTAIKTFPEKVCDVNMLKYLNDKGFDLTNAMDIACRITDIVGGPTTAQSMFVTTVTGLSVGIFGLYASTGRRWGSSSKDKSSLVQPQAPIIVQYPPNNNTPNITPQNYTNPVVDNVKFEP